VIDEPLIKFVRTPEETCGSKQIKGCGWEEWDEYTK